MNVHLLCAFKITDRDNEFSPASGKLYYIEAKYPETEQNNFMFSWNFFNSNNDLNRISLSLKQPLKDVNPETAIERFSGN